MIYIFSSLIILAGSGILIIVWKYYGAEIKKTVIGFWESKNLPKVRLPKFISEVSIPKISLSNISLPKVSLPKARFANISKDKKQDTALSRKRGVHVSSLVQDKDEEYWIEAIKKDPENPDPYIKLGVWYVDNNKNKFAIETFEYASKLDPENDKVKQHLKDLRQEA
ncbi:MAG: hypothetical protein R3346_02745 [Candidatus Spechtbacterales bacterium]|nr:hypothetical protein [Candidatus Spechtbacterales bacterium]